MAIADEEDRPHGGKALLQHYVLSGESTCSTAGFLLCLMSKENVFLKVGNWLLKIRKDNSIYCRNKAS